MKFKKRGLIIGCGIAGPAAAIFLKRAGYETVIYEAMEEPDDYAGLFLNLARNGMRVAEQMGVADRIRSEGIEMKVMRFYSGSGKRLGEVGQWNGEPQGYTVKRSFLHKVLREEAERQGIPIEYGKKLVDLKMTGLNVTASFADGSSAIGDFVVGCDGIHSAVRRIVLPDAEQPDYTGLISFGGFSRNVNVPFEPGVQHMIFGKKAFFGYVVKKDGEIYWFGNLSYPGKPTRKDLLALGQAAWKKTITELYQHDREPIPEIIRRTEGEIGVYPIYDLLSQTAWHKSSVVLIGDAIHATSPNAGQGASLALEDAMMLAKCMRDCEQTGQAFSMFHQLRRERVERIVQYSRSIGERKHAINPVQVFFRDLMLPIFLKSANKQSQEWLYDYRIEWDEALQR